MDGRGGFDFCLVAEGLAEETAMSLVERCCPVRYSFPGALRTKVHCESHIYVILCSNLVGKEETIQTKFPSV